MKKIFISFFLIFILMTQFICMPYTFAENLDLSEKIIYLTFDDGPGGKVTTDVLDILKAQDVHATFFVIGEQVKNQEDILRRMKDEGHAIGLHSMTHKKGYLYSSEQNFLKDMLETQKVIYEACGIESHILRFPFGCNNTSYKINQNIVDLLHKNNLKIYDWNVDSTDGANPHSAPSRFIKNAKSDKNPIFLLMHCTYMSKNSVKALPSIIQYYKDKGYTFKIITEDTPEEFHYCHKAKNK